MTRRTCRHLRCCWRWGEFGVRIRGDEGRSSSGHWWWRQRGASSGAREATCGHRSLEVTPPTILLILIHTELSSEIIKYTAFSLTGLNNIAYWFNMMQYMSEVIESFFWPNPNPNIIRNSENFRIRILFEILKKIRISEKVRIFEYYSNNLVTFEHNVEKIKQRAGFEKAYSKSS